MPRGAEELQPPGCEAPPPHVATAARSMSDPVLGTRNLAFLHRPLCLALLPSLLPGLQLPACFSASCSTVSFQVKFLEGPGRWQDREPSQCMRSQEYIWKDAQGEDCKSAKALEASCECPVNHGDGLPKPLLAPSEVRKGDLQWVPTGT